MTPEETGQLLRHTREEKGLTLSEVQAETKIRERYLTAMECGNLEIIPGDVYRRGFLRSYANFLGLDELALTVRERQTGPAVEVPAANQPQPTAHPVLKAPSPDPSRPRPKNPTHAKPNKPTRSASIALLALLIIILAILAYYAPRLLFGSHPTTTAKKVPARVVSGTTLRAHLPPVALTKVSDQQGLVTYRLSRGPISVTASFSALCWVSVIADGHNVTPVPGIELSSGSQTWVSQRNLQIRFGYAPGVQLRVNGQNLGTAGTDMVNTVRTFDFQAGG